jgi:hypothetical protein
MFAVVIRYMRKTTRKQKTAHSSLVLLSVATVANWLKTFGGLRASSGSLAMLAAILRASPTPVW